MVSMPVSAGLVDELCYYLPVLAQLLQRIMLLPVCAALAADADPILMDRRLKFSVQVLVL